MGPVALRRLLIASKFGLRGFSECLRAEMQDWPGIRVCDVFPTFVDTPGVSHGANYMGREIKLPPGGVSPFDVAKAMVLLAEHPRNTVIVVSPRGLPGWDTPCARPGVRWGMVRFMEAYFRRTRPVPVSDGNLFTAPDDHRICGGFRLGKPAVPNILLVFGTVLAGLWVASRVGQSGKA